MVLLIRFVCAAVINNLVSIGICDPSGWYLLWCLFLAKLVFPFFVVISVVSLDVAVSWAPWFEWRKTCLFMITFYAKFDFKTTWVRGSTSSHHEHPVCQSPAGDTENVWSMYFETNRISDNWHYHLVLKWHKQKSDFDKQSINIHGLPILIHWSI